MGISEIPQERIRFRKILGIFRKESWEIPQSQGGKRGPSLTLRDVWPPYLDFSGKFSGILREEFPKIPCSQGERRIKFNAWGELTNDLSILTNQEKFWGIFRKESLKFPRVRGKVGEFNAFWRFDHPFLTIQGKFQGIFKKESPKFPRVRRGKVGEFNALGKFDHPILTIFYIP